MDIHFTNIQLALIVIALLLIAALAVGLYLKLRKNRTLAFRSRFDQNTTAPFSNMAPLKRPKQNWLDEKPA